MFVGFARLALSIPGAGSLKDKRQVVRKVVERLKARFNASVSEVGDNDLWQRAALGLAVVGNDSAFVRECLDKAVRFVEEMYLAPVLSREVEVVPVAEFYGPDDGSSYGTAARGTERTLAEAEGHPDLPDPGGRGHGPRRARRRGR